MVTPTDTDNTIENNEIVGNANGIFVAAGVKGNTIQRNIIVGNPPLQVSIDHTSTSGFDIKNMATAGANTFGGNICVSGLNAPCPAVSPNTNSLLEDELQALGCKTYPPTPSCQLSLNQWNWYLTTYANPNATVLDTIDGTTLMTVQQYLQARLDAGI